MSTADLDSDTNQQECSRACFYGTEMGHLLRNRGIRNLIAAVVEAMQLP
jgi:nicotinamidase-related amidase